MNIMIRHWLSFCASWCVLLVGCLG